MELSKSEIKKDLKVSDRRSEFRFYPPLDDEDSLLQAMATVSHPPALDGSHIITKMHRLLGWQNNPASREKDLEQWRKKASDARDVYHRFEDEQNEWYDSFEAGRKIFTFLLSIAQEQKRILLEEGHRLQRLVEEECLRELRNSKDREQDTSSTEKAGKSKVSIRDIVEELSRRQLEYIAGRPSEDKTSAKGNHQSIITVQIDEEAMESAMKTSPVSLQDQSCSTGRSNSCGGVTIHTQNSSGSAGSRIVVKKENDAMDVDGVNVGDADAVYHEARNLQIILQQLKESMERCEMQEGDVDIFFQEREDNLSLLELVLLQRATGIPVDKRIASMTTSTAASAEADKVLAEKTFQDLLALPIRQWDAFLSETLDAMEPSGLVTRKKKRMPDHIGLNVFARHRTERGRMLMYTPLSQLEDRYFAVFPESLSTIYAPRVTGLRPEETVNIRAQFVPPMVAQAEDDALERAYIQSDAAALNLHIKQLQQSITELQKMQQEADVALKRSQLAQRNVSLEEHAEYVQYMVALAEQGVISQEALATLSTPETTAALAHYEAMQQNAGINALLGVGFGAGMGGGASGKAKGGKQKKGGFGAQRQGSNGTSSTASAFSALAALTAVTENAILSTSNSNSNLAQADVTQAETPADATLSTAVSTSGSVSDLAAVAALGGIASLGNTRGAKSDNSRRGGSRGTLHPSSRSALENEEVAGAISLEAAAQETASTVPPTGNSRGKGNRKSLPSSTDGKDGGGGEGAATAPVVATTPAVVPPDTNTSQRGKGGRRTSAAMDEAPAVSAADGTTGHSSGNKRKNDAVDTASSAGSTDHDVAVAPANKRQRVGKR
jgi:hypothetical protein